MAKSRLRTLWDATLLIGTAVAFWGALLASWMYRVDPDRISLATSTVWVFGITIALFKRLWRHTWLWLTLGVALLGHVTLHGFLPRSTPFDYGMNTVVFNLELGALLVAVSSVRDRLDKGHRKRVG